MLISASRNTEISRIIRFWEILVILVVCLLLNDNSFEETYRIILGCAVLKSLVLIGISIYLLKAGSHIFIRNWVNNNSLGDIYLLNGIPKVQVHGNGLLLAVLMINVCKTKRINLANIILLFGVLCAGNLAFILGFVLFVVYLVIRNIMRTDRNGIKIICAMIFMLLCLPFCYKYLEKKVEQKEYSNSVKIEQVKILSNTNYLFGNGLGSFISEKGKHRSYNGDIYFEIQTFYIFNQIGIIGLSLFYIISCYLIYKRKKEALDIYILYLLYSFFNPYCFDTTHMFVIIFLVNLFNTNNDIELNSLPKRHIKLKKLCS